MPITTSVMRDDGGEQPAHCLLVAYRSEKDALDALAMLSAVPLAAPAPGVPVGYVLVPLEPTDRMTAIGQNLRYQSARSISASYREMLAAAPQKFVRGLLSKTQS